MCNYDFLILQSHEFECLSRDLLQKKEKLFVESFTPGKDGGVDLRFAKVRGENSIVQVKRYKNFSSLKEALKKEVEKVKLLNPERYIICTSVGLSPYDKDIIQSFFSPYIKSTTDILGKDDLNNLLGEYPDVEKRYYKLWMGSTAVLEGILNKRINNWTAIEMDKIRKNVSTYVMNKSFNDALNILIKERYVIISGIPGIGKTTLARMLVNYLLSKDFEEFVMLEGVGDAAQKLTEGKKQVFLFDDFLGSTTFQNDEKGFDRKLVAFIDKVRHETDKLFILCTREYILAQAKQTFEVFTTNNIEIAKCILNLSDYTESIRAKILYNHLAISGVPISYVKALLSNRSYLKIIKHNNFNPRIIETFLNKKLYAQVDPREFVSKFEEFFDRPFAVWELAFKQLNPIAQYALLIRMSMGEEQVLLSDWYQATKYFVKGTSAELNLHINDIIWRDTLKIIEGTFIITYKMDSGIVVKYMNPSVFDFLLEWIRPYKETQELIIRESYYVEQLFLPFSDINNTSNDHYGRIKMDESSYPIFETAYKRHLTDIRSCGLNKYVTVPSRKTMHMAEYLYMITRSFGRWTNDNPQLLSDIVTQEMMLNPKVSLFKRLILLDRLDDVTKQSLDIESLVTSYFEESDSLDDIVNVMIFHKNTDTVKRMTQSESFLEKVEYAIDNELGQAETPQECEIINSHVSVLAHFIPSLNEKDWQDAISETMSNIPDGPDFDDSFSSDFSTGSSSVTTDYDEMFTSLLETVNE